MLTATVWFHWIMAAILALFILVLAAFPKRWIIRILEYSYIIALCTIAYTVGEDRFGFVRLLSYGLFLHLPLAILASSLVLGIQSKRVPFYSILVAFVILLIGLDAFFIEPHWLSVKELEIRSAKLQQPIKIALLADLQTDHIGEYEKEVFIRTCKEKPDLIFFAGDYIQSSSIKRFQDQAVVLNQLLQQLPCHPKHGIVAIEGNVDPVGWKNIFANLPFSSIRTNVTRTYHFGKLAVTALSWRSSRNTRLSLPALPEFHIVLGHAPDFSLGNANADLMLAGHTHGGQVQIPFFGPLVTLSKVPRNWASGITALPNNKYLVVSNGIGLERGFAPRMRFWCRPQIVIINLMPI